MRCKALLWLMPCLLLTSCSSFWDTVFPDDGAETPKQEAVAPVGLKKRVLLLHFLNRTNLGADLLPQAVDEIVASAVHAAPDCVLVPETDIDGYETFASPGAYFNYKTIFERARAYGISGVVLGSVEALTIQEKGDEIGLFRTRYYTATARVRLAIYDAATERQLVEKVVTGTVSEERTRMPGERAPGSEDAERGKAAIAKALEPLIPQFPDFVRKIAWRGRIAKIDLHRYYINAGEDTGIGLGQLLKVFGDGAPVTDPQTGTLLGMAPGQFKGLLKVVDFLGKDGAVAVVHSGGGFREQDSVEVYSPPAGRF